MAPVLTGGKIGQLELAPVLSGENFCQFLVAPVLSGASSNWRKFLPISSNWQNFSPVRIGASFKWHQFLVKFFASFDENVFFQNCIEKNFIEKNFNRKKISAKLAPVYANGRQFSVAPVLNGEIFASLNWRNLKLAKIFAS